MNILAEQRQNPNFLLQIAIVLSGIFVAVFSGFLASEAPLMVILLIIALVISFFSLIKPDLMTLTFFFIMTTNIAIVSVKFHNVPFVVAAAFPLLLGVPLVNYIIIRRQKIVFTPIMIPLFAYFFAQIMGSFGAISIGDALEELLTFMIEGIAIYILILNSIRSMKTLRRVIRVMMIGIIFMSSFPIYQQVTGTFDNEYWGMAQVPGKAFDTGGGGLTGQETQARLAGAIGEKNFFGMIMLMLGFIMVPQITESKSISKKLLASGATVAALVVANLTFSRGVAMSFAGTLVIAAFLSIITRRQLGLMLIAAIGLLIAFPQFSNRLLSISDSVSFATGDNTTSTDVSTEGRATQMLAAMIIYSKSPLFGVGPNQYRLYVQEVGNTLGIKRLNETRQAHNLYLGIAANNGTVGLVAVMAMIIMTLAELEKVRKRWKKDYPQLSSFAAGFTLAIISFLMNGMFLHFSYVRYFWMVMAIAGSVIYISKQLDNKHLIEAEKKKIAVPETSFLLS